MRICFATNNNYKLIEIRHKLGKAYDIISLSDLGHLDELPETQETLEGNSMQKALFVHNLYGIDCFADDTGLVVDALQGAPGVHSARYAGPERSSEANVALLLKNLAGVQQRSARFITVMTLLYQGGVHTFTGTVEGTIAESPRGGNGFGYDPLFVPEGWEKTFAELDLAEKNTFSHRSIAVDRLVAFLKKTI